MSFFFKFTLLNVFSPTSFHTFYNFFTIPHSFIRTATFFSTIFYSFSHTLGGVKCQKCSAYYVANLISLIADSFFFVTIMLGTLLSLVFWNFFKQFQFRRHSLAFQFTNFVDKPNFSHS